MILVLLVSSFWTTKFKPIHLHSGEGRTATINHELRGIAVCGLRLIDGYSDLRFLNKEPRC